MASRAAVVYGPTSPGPFISGHRPAGVAPRRHAVHLRTTSFIHRSTRLRIIMLPPAIYTKRYLVAASASTAETLPSASNSEFLDFLERCFAATTHSGPSSSSAGVISPTTKKEFGAHGTVTLQKSKLDLSQKTTKLSPELATGGGGGDIGKKNFHGGGDGGDDDGDDDDYFDDFDDENEGDEGGWFRKRIVIQELFDRKFVDAVFTEWYKTMSDLPAGLRQLCEMGLLSSAQVVRFLTINARPTTSRLISRALPSSLSRAFIGRMISDPSFLYKLLLEQTAIIGSTVWWEFKNRRGRIKEEWDLALINVVTVAACNAFVIWSLAPCRSYGNNFQFDLQNTIQKLPNNVFEKSYPLREFDLQKRVHSFFYKAAELCLVGLTAGSIQGSLTKILSSKKEGRLSVTIPSVSNNALGYGAFLGLYANLRYQLLCGIDRAMFDRFEVLGVGLIFSSLLRVLNVHVGERSRLAWLGIEADPLARSHNLLTAHTRTSANAINKQSPNWFISKNAIISGLGLLGLGQGTADLDGGPSKPRRKRIIKKKMSTSSA
ncbi:hypothetical protein KSP40_PGU022396 [Platanthera guangdongensis]|uniref:Protein RETICULATA-RELATED 1, chloroplastic n=1 Tax=Platanthera guangdongensis TaxID=2320717 RepID=A0ABR2MQX2_9ASPA